MTDRVNTIVIVNTILICLTFFSLLVRLITRIRAGQSGADDVWLCFGTVAAVVVSICCAIATHYGLGKHAHDQQHSQVKPYQQLLLAANFFYYAGNSLVKISILVFYKRIEKRKNCLYFIYVMMFVVGGFGIGRCVAAVCQCIPLSKLWNKTEPGTCFNVITSYYTNSGIMFTTDIIVYMMPVEFVLRMDMPARQKLGMIGLFFLGGFVCIASAVRLAMVHNQVKYGDATYNVALVFVWSSVEVHTAICATCAPFFRAFYRRYSPLGTVPSTSGKAPTTVAAVTYSSASPNLSEMGLGATFVDYTSSEKSKSHVGGTIAVTELSSSSSSPSPDYMNHKSLSEDAKRSPDSQAMSPTSPLTPLTPLSDDEKQGMLLPRAAGEKELQW